MNGVIGGMMIFLVGGILAWIAFILLGVLLTFVMEVLEYIIKSSSNTIDDIVSWIKSKL